MKNQEKLESLLEKGIITQEEFDHLQRQRNGEKPSLGKNILSFILTIFAIGAVMFGTCLMNLAIVNGMRSDVLTGVLMVVWPLFPVVLFGWIAHKTKNAGMKWAVIILATGALFVAATILVAATMMVMG